MRKCAFSTALMWTITIGYTIQSSAVEVKNFPEQKHNKTNCPNSTLDDGFQPSCPGTGRRIAIESLSYNCTGAKNCKDDINTKPVPRYTLQWVVPNVLGEPVGFIRVASSICNNKPGTFMRMRYYCIPNSSLLEICSAQTIALKEIVYLMSKKYPHPNGTHESACNCSVTLNVQNISLVTTPQLAMANISVITLHSELVAGQQLVIMSPNGSMLKNITNDDHEFTISYEQFLYTTVIILWKSTTTLKDGRFWMGFQSSDPGSTVTISCQKPVSLPTIMPTQPIPITTSVSSRLSSSTAVSSSTMFSFQLTDSVPMSVSSVFNSSSSISLSPYLTSSPYALLGSSVSSTQKQAPVTYVIVSTVSTRHEETKETPEDNTINLIPTIAGILGAIILLVIIIIIICILKRKKSKQNTVVPEKTREAANSKRNTQVENGINKADDTSSQIPALPPIVVSGSKTVDLADDVVSHEETKRKKKKRKKKQRWTDKVSDQDVDVMENAFDTEEQSELDYNNLVSEKHNMTAGNKVSEVKKRRKKRKRNKEDDLSALTGEDEQRNDTEL